MAEPPRVTPPAPSERQSIALPPGISISPNALGIGIGVPPATPAGASADRETTGSIRQPTVQAAATPPAAPTPSPQPSPARGTPRRPAARRHRQRRPARRRREGDAAAEFEIATRFAEGRGVPQNLPEAAAWFERAANKGLVPAQFRLGGLYEKGMGVQKNLDTARRLYVSAAEAGHAKAMHNLAVLYAEGVDGKPDYQTAARWFRKAADHGVVDSQYNLGDPLCPRHRRRDQPGGSLQVVRAGEPRGRPRRRQEARRRRRPPRQAVAGGGDGGRAVLAAAAATRGGGPGAGPAGRLGRRSGAVDRQAHRRPQGRQRSRSVLHNKTRQKSVRHVPRAANAARMRRACLLSSRTRDTVAQLKTAATAGRGPYILI